MITTQMNNEVRLIAEKAFWMAFLLDGYEPEHITKPPTPGETRAWERAKARAFLAADKAAWKEFQLRGVIFEAPVSGECQDKVDCPF